MSLQKHLLTTHFYVYIYTNVTWCRSCDFTTMITSTASYPSPLLRNIYPSLRLGIPGCSVSWHRHITPCNSLSLIIMLLAPVILIILPLLLKETNDRTRLKTSDIKYTSANLCTWIDHNLLACLYEYTLTVVAASGFAGSPPPRSVVLFVSMVTSGR